MLESLKKNEAFSYKKLTADEMSSRGILGRLVGPCADFTIPTRNGRKYNESLWDKVFADEIVNEKIANKCLFGELGHPLDREEVDPEKIAIALNEPPKKNAEGQLVACFDILNTPCGKILKTLCDYGTTIGISSRGSGDIIREEGEEIVDPETYNFECFDAVLLPAVKAARLNYMTESVDQNTLKMKKSLTEELEKASIEDKKIMEETLSTLNIKLTEDSNTLPGGTPKNIEDIPMASESEEENIVLTEETEEETENTDIEETETVKETDEIVTVDVDEKEVVDEEPEEDNSVKDEPELSETENEFTVGELIAKFNDYDETLPVELSPIEIEGVTYDVTLEFTDSDESIKIGVICEPQETAANSENIDIPEEEYSDGEIVVDTATEAEEIEVVEPELENEVTEEEANDIGDDEVIESLKEMVKQKDLLENEIKSLKNEKAVSDAKVKELTEQLNQYKAGFIRVSEIAKKVPTLEKEVVSLKEEMTQKDSNINVLESKLAKSVILTEAAVKEKDQIKVLTEKLNNLKDESEQTEETLKDQIAKYKAKLEESTKVAKSYKQKCSMILNRYIESKANLLGVNPKDITSRLNESYTLTDIDNVCDELLSYNVSMNRLPFGVNRASTIKMRESTNTTKRKEVDPVDGYEIDDSLLELAGLKK